jgi:hypothetical protein
MSTWGPSPCRPSRRCRASALRRARPRRSPPCRPSRAVELGRMASTASLVGLLFVAASAQAAAATAAALGHADQFQGQNAVEGHFARRRNGIGFPESRPPWACGYRSIRIIWGAAPHARPPRWRPWPRTDSSIGLMGGQRSPAGAHAASASVGAVAALNDGLQAKCRARPCVGRWRQRRRAYHNRKATCSSRPHGRACARLCRAQLCTGMPSGLG